MMKQGQYQPLSIGEMALSLYSINEGYFDDVDASKVVAFEAGLHSYAGQNHQDLMDKIVETGKFNDEITDGLKSVVEGFKANGVW